MPSSLTSTDSDVFPHRISWPKPLFYHWLTANLVMDCRDCSPFAQLFQVRLTRSFCLIFGCKLCFWLEEITSFNLSPDMPMVSLRFVFFLRFDGCRHSTRQNWLEINFFTKFFIFWPWWRKMLSFDLHEARIFSSFERKSQISCSLKNWKVVFICRVGLLSASCSFSLF